jgi:hypothetical protein
VGNSRQKRPGVEQVINAITSRSDDYARPGFRDWMLLGIGVTFVLCGLIPLFNGALNVGIVTITLFGLCTATSAASIIRRLRFPSPSPAPGRTCRRHSDQAFACLLFHRLRRYNRGGCGGHRVRP